MTPEMRRPGDAKPPADARSNAHSRDTPDRRLPPPVVEINRIRTTAREIVNSDAAFRPKVLALLTLGFEAADELGEWGQRAVWQESREFFGDPRPKPPILGDPFVRAHRSLRAQGFTTCPRCHSRLLDELDFEREAQLRKAWG